LSLDKEKYKGCHLDCIYYKKVISPLGPLLIGANDVGCHFIRFGDTIEPLFKKFRIIEERNHNYIERIEEQLNEYFSGKRENFTIITVLRGTPFQIDVWKALMQIPYAETVSYKFIAETIGKPNAFRAIGMANHANSIPIIIPCHRVIMHNGSLGGYGGGIDKKILLLDLETAFGKKGINRI